MLVAKQICFSHTSAQTQEYELRDHKVLPVMSLKADLLLQSRFSKFRKYFFPKTVIFFSSHFKLIGVGLFAFLDDERPQSRTRKFWKEIFLFSSLPDPPVHPRTRLDNIHKIIFFTFSENIFIKIFPQTKYIQAAFKT